MNRMAKIFLWTVITILAITSVLVMYGEGILFYTAPKVMLINALENTSDHLNQRFQSSIFHIAKKYIDPDGNYSADVSMQLPHKYLGMIDSNLSLQICTEKHNFFAEGTVNAIGLNLDPQIYIDADFLAIKEPDITNETFFGITFDTFLQDIQKIPLIDYLIPAKTLVSWDRAVQKIRSYMFWDMPDLSIFRIGQKEKEQLRLGILALPCNTEKRTFATKSATRSCYAMIFKIPGEDLKSYLPNMQWQTEDHFEIVFYCLDNQIQGIKVNCRAKEMSHVLNIDLGNPDDDSIMIKYWNNQSVDSWELTISTAQSDSSFTENWTFLQNNEKRIITNQYQQASNRYDLTMTGKEGEISAIVTDTQDGLQLEILEIDEILTHITNGIISTDLSESECVAVIKAGSNILRPEYVNLDKWTMDDLWNIVSNIAKILGAKILPQEG